MLQEIKEGIREESRSVKKRKRLYADNQPAILQVATALNAAKIEIIRASLDSEDVNLYITGDYAVLKGIFHVFRTLGYEPSSRPEKQEPSFTCYFHKKEQKMAFYLSFSSTICKRKKIGTKMVEQDIYETVCE